MFQAATQGKLLFVITAAAYIYYTIWVLGTPFIDHDHPALLLFPDTYYAIAIPTYAGVLLFSATLVTLGCFLLASELQKLKQSTKQPTTKSD